MKVSGFCFSENSDFYTKNIPFFVLANKNKTKISVIPIYAFYFCCGIRHMLSANAGRILYAFIPC